MNAAGMVYIVDDDEICREMAAFALTEGGFKTRSFDCAESFLEAFKAKEVACVVVDMNMPGMSGYDMQLRLQELGSDVPLLFVSAETDVTTANAVLMNGAEDMLQKPIEPAELLEKVRAAIERGRERSKQGNPFLAFFSKLGSLFGSNKSDISNRPAA